MKRCLPLILCLLLMAFAHAEVEPLQARMDQAAWPTGADALGFTLTAPGGGIRYYNVPGDIERLEAGDGNDGRWESVASAYDYCGCDQRAFGNYYADELTGVKQLRGYLGGDIHLILPLTLLEPLSPGKYRLCYAEIGDEWKGDTEKQYVEFEVSADAPPAIPAEERNPDFTPPEHVPAHMDAAYDSCQDNESRNGDIMFFQLGDTVMEWRGLFKNYDSWFPDRYWLFSYPAGHPEQALLVRGDMEIEVPYIYDTGTGWLVDDYVDGYSLLDYDGGNRVPLYVPDMHGELLIGGMFYYSLKNGLYRAPVDPFVPERIYTANLNEDYGSDEPEDILDAEDAVADMDVPKICYGGTLYFADHGIMALDLQTLETRRITDRLYNGTGHAGFAFFILNDRLYTCLDKDEGMVSMDLDGGDIRKVSDEVYYVNQISGGIVLALKGRTTGWPSGGFESAAFYLPDDPENPVFDPDHCRRQDIDNFDFILGDWLYHETESGYFEVSPVASLFG